MYLLYQMQHLNRWPMEPLMLTGSRPTCLPHAPAQRAAADGCRLRGHRRQYACLPRLSFPELHTSAQSPSWGASPTEGPPTSPHISSHILRRHHSLVHFAEDTNIPPRAREAHTLLPQTPPGCLGAYRAAVPTSSTSILRFPKKQAEFLTLSLSSQRRTGDHRCPLTS